MGQWIVEHTPPKSVILHGDTHISPAGCLAGRPSLVAYNGWMWSHGYNYGDRDRDRQCVVGVCPSYMPASPPPHPAPLFLRRYVMANALKDSDPEAVNAMRRWGTRYVLGESMRHHDRPQAKVG